MKNKIITLTENLSQEGFKIKGIEVENNGIVRIKFLETDNLEVLVNNSSAKIKNGNCSKNTLTKLEKIVKKHYKIEKEIEPKSDIFSKLLNAS
jgi:hypothetical protein